MRARVRAIVHLATAADKSRGFHSWPRPSATRENAWATSISATSQAITGSARGRPCVAATRSLPFVSAFATFRWRDSPSNISYLWNFGSLLAFCLVIQIITGVTLAMHYNASVLEAFNSIEHIMKDGKNGWLIRYLHANTASAFFFLVYLHIGRGIYYGSL